MGVVFVRMTINSLLQASTCSKHKTEASNNKATKVRKVIKLTLLRVVLFFFLTGT